MHYRHLLYAAAAGLALMAGLAVTNSVFAHAVITQLAWDDPHHPSTLTATSGEDEISDEPGTFYLKVFDSDGHQVDNGDTKVVGPKEMAVTVKAGLTPGQYRVDWKTASADDGDEADGSQMIEVLAAGESGAGAATSADHHHDEEQMAPSMATAPAAPPAKLTTPVTFDVHLAGANEVPPVSSPLSALARFVFNPQTNTLHYDITVSGVSPNLVTAAHIHRAPAGTNGPGAFPIADSGFTQISGEVTLKDADVTDLLAGNFYVNVHSVAFPGGAARGQLIVPSVPAVPAAPIKPPATGDGGLLSQPIGVDWSVFALLAAAGALASLSVFAASRR
jgi:methionine-rich copper-binding protein CopC